MDKEERLDGRLKDQNGVIVGHFSQRRETNAQCIPQLIEQQLLTQSWLTRL